MESSFFCTDKIVRRYFESGTYNRGEEYFKKARVKRCVINQKNELFWVAGVVKGDGRYSVTCKVNNEGEVLAARCDCYVQVDCKHAVALLLEAIANEHRKELDSFRASDSVLDSKIMATMNASMKQKLGAFNKNNGVAALNPSIKNWLTQMNQAVTHPVDPYAYPASVKERLLYVLNITAEKIPQITFYYSRILKTGAYSDKPRKLSNSIFESQAQYILPCDKEILDLLRLERIKNVYQHDCVNLSTARVPELLNCLLKTERFYFQDLQKPCLHSGPAQQAALTWLTHSTGEQELRCQLNDGTYCYTLNLNPLWYINPNTQEIGKLELELPAEMVIPLLKAPLIAPELALRVGQELTKILEKQIALPLPTVFEKTLIENIQPQVNMEFLVKRHKAHYWDQEDEIPCFALNFRYADLPVLPFANEVMTEIFHQNKFVTLKRDNAFEKNTVSKLQKFNFHPVSKLLKQASSNLFMFREDDDILLEKMWMHFMNHELPLLRQAGWAMHFTKDFPFCFIQADENEWYSELFEKSDNQWFDLELGITVEGQKINLLQPLLEMIRAMPQYFTKESINELPETESIPILLEDGRRLILPVIRIKPILEVLTELFDSATILDEGKLELSILRSAQLADLMAAASEASKFRWLGGERLRKLGEKLRQFKGIEAVDPPIGLKAELRPYQREGLSWLQFLREYELAGILADDMGLGKTVQALAHILLEKESGRMIIPTLVIAPTSLMFNWRMEAEKFTPQLRVLTLHGNLRKEHFENVQNYDLILTTYPLIVRDEDFLVKQRFYYLILDEAHIIKNPKAKATQIVQLIQAQHRLCLSGTPMENHLGELWSLFHFLLPSLLGEQKQFVRLFRTPIEKHQDGERRASLAKRVAPFLLRRKKSEVVKELPEKVELLRTIEIESAQRDLYESIRLAMHEKVSQAIYSKGLNRSHIIILDALLKLRQICCDPRLLKMDTVKKKKVNSAKLDFLLELVPTLLEEGRQILLFSQFTEMLELIEQALKEKNIEYVKLTGQTKDRQTPIEHFQKGKVKLFLISLKAGGVGLNLTAADTVIHYDPWWNPAVEQQATDRAHRIGQSKTVFVYKLITQGTVEEKIVAMQDRKRALLEGLFSEQTTEKNKLSANDLTELFAS